MMLLVSDRSGQTRVIARCHVEARVYFSLSSEGKNWARLFRVMLSRSLKQLSARMAGRTTLGRAISFVRWFFVEWSRGMYALGVAGSV